MTTYNTGNPLGSAAAKDLYDNAENLDNAANRQDSEWWTDRVGNTRQTWYGFEQQQIRSIVHLGLNPVGTFQNGAILTAPNDIIQDSNSDLWYRWDDMQTLPKTVPPGSTPSSSGGINPGAWQMVDVTDVLRRELKEDRGAGGVGTASGETVQEVLDDHEDRIAVCERSSRVENFHTLADTCVAELLSLNAPEVYDKSITLTVNEDLTTDYSGPVTGHCSIGNPQNYTLALYTSSTLEYRSDAMVLNTDGTFSFKRSWPGVKSFKLFRTSNNGLVTVWEDPLCIRSYRMPADAGDETVRVMKDRCYTYDQAVSAIALIAQGHSQVDRFIRGVCAIVGSGGGEGSVPFFVNRMSAQTSSQYYRTGNAAWTGYALAYYLLKYPHGNQAVVVRDKLTQCTEWIETFRIKDRNDLRYGLYASGSGRYQNGVFYPDFEADWCTAEHQF
ncbi:hypothetical protein NRY58_001317, partial [Salmonella enterica]|nr:hypothetical protein [Salmonella enterica]